MFCLLVGFVGEKASILHTERKIQVYGILLYLTMSLYTTTTWSYDSYVLFTTLLHTTTIYNNLIEVLDPQGKTT